MKLKKIIGLALAALMVVGLAACRSDDEVIRMGTNAEFPPFEFVVDGGDIIGIDVAIARAIAEELGKRLEIVDMEFASLLIALNNNEVDFVAAGMTASGPRGEERRESVDFSIPYYRAMQAIIVSADNTEITSAADLQGRNVAAIAGYTGYDVARGDLGLQNVSAFSSPAFAVTALQQGSVEAIVIDYTTAIALSNLNDGLRVVTDEPVFGNEYYAIAVRQGDTELLDTINLVLERLIESGELDRIIAYYTERMQD